MRAILVICAFALLGQDAVEFTEDEIKIILSHEWKSAPPDPTNKYADDPNAAKFGRAMFFETRFSSTGEVSCATCHDPALGFGDGLQHSEGIATLTRHSQSLFNLGHNRWFFWDGRADTLWSQALIPFEDEREFGGSRTRVARVVCEDPAIRRSYEFVFGKIPTFDEGRLDDGPDARPVPGDAAHPHQTAWDALAERDREAVNTIFVNVGKAIAAYERYLVSRDSPFDRFAAALRAGDEAGRSALSPAAQRGLELFISPSTNCRLCHVGPMFTDGEFHSTGVPPLAGGQLTDPGRYDGVRDLLASEFGAGSRWSDDPEGRAARLTGFLRRSPEMWGEFKTPSLRSVATSAPYMHEGQFATLEDVVRFYSTREGAIVGHHQETTLVPLGLSESQLADLVAFLESLTGAPLPKALLGPPAPTNGGRPP